MSVTRKANPPQDKSEPVKREIGEIKYLAYCADIEPMVRLTLVGSETAIMERCLVKAQAKRVMREMIARFDGRPPLGSMKDEKGAPTIGGQMKMDYTEADRRLARAMFAQVEEWREALTKGLPYEFDKRHGNEARIAAITSGCAPAMALACMGSSWFAKREGIHPQARIYAAELAGPVRSRAARMAAPPSPDEDALAR